MIRSGMVALLASALLAGCAHEREKIPVYPRLPEAAALKILRDRSHAIRSISAQGSITLTRPNGDAVRLDTVIVLRPPDHARLRAWKFSQAVFDMTLTPDGLWMIVSKNDEHRRELLAAGSNAGRLTRRWLQLITGSFDNPKLALRGDSGRLFSKQPSDDSTTISCEIDRATLTPRRYTVNDSGGTARFTLTLSDYAEFPLGNGGAGFQPASSRPSTQDAGSKPALQKMIVWPRKIEAVSESGRILVELREVEINGDLPPAAFHPPARAEKLP